MPDDALYSLLKSAPLTESQRAAAWDAFAAAKSPDDLTAALRSLPIPQGVKAALWEMKASGAPAAPPRDTLSGIDAKGSVNAGAGTGAEKKREVVGRALRPDEKAAVIGKDLAVGLGKSAANTAVGAATIMSAVPVVGRAIEYVNERAYGLSPEQQQGQRDYIANVDLAPTNTAQTVGKGVGDIAQMVLPGNAVNRLGIAAASRMPLGLKVASRLGVEAAGGAGMAQIQNQDPTMGAMFGAGGAAVGVGLSSAGKFLAEPASAALRKAVEFAEARGIALDAATMTGNQFLRRAQNFLGKATVGGAAVQEAHERLRQDGLQRVGSDVAGTIHRGAVTGVAAGKAIQKTAQRLAAKEYERVAGNVFDQPISREQAGGAVESGLLDRVKQQGAIAKQQYGIVDQAEADSTAQISRDLAERNNVFKWNGNDRQLRAKAWEDAKQAGFSGTRQEFDYLLTQRMNDAEDLVNQVNGEGDFGRRVLEFIAESGGIGRGKEPVYTGEVQALWDSATPTRVMHKAVTASGKAAQFPRGSIGGVDGVVNKDGLTLAEMAERVRNNPEFGTTFEGLADTDLVQVIEEMARTAGRIKATPGEALAHVGVRPGAAWWSDAANAGTEGAEKSFAGRITGEVTPDDVPVGLPVDQRPFKERFGAIVEKELQAIRAAQGTANPALVALKQMLDGPDVVPWSVAERNLSEFKRIARKGVVPGLDGRSEGLAKIATGKLEVAIQEALAGTPEAADALTKARAATVAKYRAGNFAKALGVGGELSSPVKAFKKLVTPGDTNLPTLRRAIAELPPDEARKIGRAWLDDATGALESTKFNSPRRARAAVDKLDALGAETKRLLFGSDTAVATLREGLDRRASWLEAAMSSNGRRDPKLLYRELISANDGGIEKLRGIPAGERKKVARAFLDQMLEDAAGKAGTRAESTVWGSWLKMSPEKRELLIPDPQVRQNVDDLALFGLRSSEDMNPSGSGYMLGMAEYLRSGAKALTGLGTLGVAGSLATGNLFGVAGALSVVSLASGLGAEGGAFALNKMLHSPKAMALARRITSTPPERVAQTSMMARQLSGLIGADVTVHPAAVPEAPAEKERR